MKTAAELNAIVRQVADEESNPAAVLIAVDLDEGGKILISAVAPDRPSIVKMLQRLSSKSCAATSMSDRAPSATTKRKQ